jgi:threonine aldolase
MSRSSRLIAVRNLSFGFRPLPVFHLSIPARPIIPLQRTFASSAIKMGDAISEKPHNAWLGAKGPAALDLRSTSTARTLVISGPLTISSV